MKNIIKKLISLVLIAATLLSVTACNIIAGDGNGDSIGDSVNPHPNAAKPTPEEEKSNSLIDDSMFIKAEGELLKTAAGDIVYLRGVNAGGLFVMENWMQKIFKYNVLEDGSKTAMYDKQISEIFLERFGREKTEALWQEFRDNWFSDEDFKICKELGINVIRLPITYMTVDFDAVVDYNLAAYEYDFSLVDAFIEKAASYGIYTILDLHGAYGSQNGANHSGDVKVPTDFYSNEEMKQLTVDLWRAMAEHYKGNPAIAAYDILNEPGEHKIGGGTQSTTTRHWQFMDRLYDAIREVDTEHVVIFESCWGASNLPMPSEYGWENCMYSFHHYSNKYGADPSAHNNSILAKINEMKAANFGIPLHMGEFTCYDNKEQWEYTLNAFNENGIHWNSWTYKIHNNTENYRFWGYVNVTSDIDQLDLFTDSYEKIFAAFSQLKTGTHTKVPTFSDGTSFHDVIKKYATAE